MNETSRPMLAQPREITRVGSRDKLLDKVIENTQQGGFDIDAWHVMDRRDNTLIADEVLNGAGSNKFVYSFAVSGKEVSGVSVIGARHLMSIYGGLKHRIVASTQKIGSLHVFKSYPGEGQRMHVQAESISSLGDEPDYYEVLVEISDIKTGNSIQVEKRESAVESRSNGTTYGRPHYQLIAQSKALRNGVLDIIPQDVVLKWKNQQLALGKNDVITEGVRDQKLSAILQFATSKAIPVDRHQVEELTMDQITGLREAAQAGQAAFVNAALALGLIATAEDGAEATVKKTTAKPTNTARKPAQTSGGMPETDPGDPGPGDMRSTARTDPPHDPETGEIKKEAAPTNKPAPTATKGNLF